MRLAVCPLCGGVWSVLGDGTLVQHPQANFPALLCPGSRSRAKDESCAPPPKPVGPAQAERRTPAPPGDTRAGEATTRFPAECPARKRTGGSAPSGREARL
jgi:hypothetical protein